MASGLRPFQVSNSWDYDPMIRIESAWLKIDRAEKHIDDLDAIIGSLPDAYVSSIEADSQGRGNSIKYHLPNDAAINREMGLIIGDAIHNLKTALDHAWIVASGSDAKIGMPSSPFAVLQRNLRIRFEGRR